MPVDYLPEDLQGDGVRFLDRIVGGIALMAHSCVVMTLSLANDGMMSRFVSIYSQLLRIASNDQIPESTDQRSSSCPLSIKAPWLLDPYSNLGGPNPAKRVPHGAPPTPNTHWGCGLLS